MTRNSLKLYFSRHAQAFLMSLGWLTKNPLTNFITIMVLTMTLTLPGLLFIFVKNGQIVTQKWNNGAQMSLYLKKETSPEIVQRVIGALKTQPEIKQVIYISPEQGLSQFIKQTQMEASINALEDNPLPGVIIVTPKAFAQSDIQLNRLASQFKRYNIVNSVKLDMQWLQRLHAIINLIKRSVYTLGFLLAIAVFFIVGNTIHLATQEHRKEIEIYKLIGATHAFIRRPFLYSGMWYGFFAGLLAWLTLSIVSTILRSSAQKLAMLYQSHIMIVGLGFHDGLMLILISTLLGLSGAWLAVSNDVKIL